MEKINQTRFNLRIISVVALFEYLGIFLFFIRSLYVLFFTMAHNQVEGMENEINRFFIPIFLFFIIAFILYLIFIVKNNDLSKRNPQQLAKLLKIEKVLLFIFIAIPIIIWLITYFN